jgi:hypothetical protein
MEVVSTSSNFAALQNAVRCSEKAGEASSATVSTGVKRNVPWRLGRKGGSIPFVVQKTRGKNAKARLQAPACCASLPVGEIFTVEVFAIFT